MTSRKKPGVVFWATVVLVPVLVYVASWGPACWLHDMRWIDSRPITIVYWPIGKAYWGGPEPVSNAIFWWGDFACPEESVAAYSLLLEMKPTRQ